MNSNLVVLALISLLVACGSSTGPDGEQVGGSSGSGGGGSDAGSAGKSQGGQGGAGGSSAGQAGEGGKIVVGGGGGVAGTGTGGGGGVAGTGTAGAGGVVVDPRCPAREPTGACSEEAELICSYDLVGCLCAPQADSPFAYCARVDPACPSVAPPPADEADMGSGGFKAAIAAPSRRSCRCTNEMWSCNYGF